MTTTKDSRFLPKTSDKYAVVKTADIISKLESKGFKLVDFSKKRLNKRNKDRDGFQMHVVTMELVGAATSIGSPRIVFKNSHDGTASLQFYVGFIRFACSNGLIAGDFIVPSVKFRHSGDILKRTEEIIEWATVAAKKLAETYDAMSKRILTDNEIAAFRKKAASLRGLEDLDITPRRDADTGNDLFTVYNRVQESLVRGGGIGQKVAEKEGNVVNITRKLREIKSAGQSLKLNVELSNMTAEWLTAA